MGHADRTVDGWHGWDPQELAVPDGWYADGSWVRGAGCGRRIMQWEVDKRAATEGPDAKRRAPTQRAPGFRRRPFQY